jgi:hypothetical protein
MRAKLTDQLCSQRPPKTGRIEIWDLLLPGLCIRIYPSGAHTFSIMPREWIGADGRRKGIQKHRRISLWPRHPELSLAEARKQARELMLTAQAGGKLPEAKLPSQTTEAILTLWMKLDQGQHRTRETIEWRMRRALAPWLDKPIASIRRSDIRRVIDETRDQSGPVAARHAHASLHRMFK